MITKEQLDPLLMSTWVTEEQKEHLQKEFMDFVNSDGLYVTPEIRKVIEKYLNLFYHIFFRGYLVDKRKIKALAYEIVQLTQ